ncbi:MAG: phosphatase PAP2 family protein [Acidobacteriota bacterium]|nr:phosphatase PAP2 family protein [Acidobacteriota bacterium]
MKRILIGLTLALATLLVFALLTSEMLEGETLHFDGNVRNWVHAHSSGGLTTVMRAISFAGSPGVLGPAAILLFFLLRHLKWRREGNLLLVVMLGALLLEQVLKLIFHRARPESFFGLPAPRSYSYPSGHALFAVCFFGCLAWILAAHWTSRASRAMLWTGALLIAALIGYSRIYLGVHYPTDVIAGYASALVWLTFLGTGDQWRAR